MSAIDEFKEGDDALARTAGKHGLDIGVAHDAVNGTVARVTFCNEPFHGHVAQPARRNICDPQKADIILGIEKELEISEQVFDLTAIKEALAADEVVANVALAQSHFQRARLLIRA